jgi:hypothetical protein
MKFGSVSTRYNRQLKQQYRAYYLSGVPYLYNIDEGRSEPIRVPHKKVKKLVLLDASGHCWIRAWKRLHRRDGCRDIAVHERSHCLLVAMLCSSTIELYSPKHGKLMYVVPADRVVSLMSSELHHLVCGMEDGRWKRAKAEGQSLLERC